MVTSVYRLAVHFNYQEDMLNMQWLNFKKTILTCACQKIYGFL